MFARDLITAGRRLILNPDNWFKGAEARTAKGIHCSPKDPRAACFCSIGAIFAYDSGQQGQLAVNLLDEATNALTGGQFTSIVSYNDNNGTTHEDILKVWDKADELAEAQLSNG